MLAEAEPVAASAFSEIVQPSVRRPPQSGVGTAAPYAAASEKQPSHRPQDGSAVAAGSFKSPQRVYEEALNFEERVRADEATGAVLGGVTENAVALKFSRLLRAFNDSEVLYPTFVLVVSALSLVIVVFQKTVSILVKCILVVLYLVLLLTTVVTFKNRG